MAPQKEQALRAPQTSKASKARRRQRYKIKKASAQDHTSGNMEMDDGGVAAAGDVTELDGQQNAAELAGHGGCGTPPISI